MALKHYTGLRRKTLIPHLTLPFHPLAKQKSTKIYQIKASATSPKVTGRNLRVVVVGGGPTGGSAVVTLTKGRIKTFQIERSSTTASLVVELYYSTCSVTSICRSTS
ncbi:hypothetical protein Dimus_035418 [Dionaea muscipula]